MAALGNIISTDNVVAANGDTMTGPLVLDDASLTSENAGGAVTAEIDPNGQLTITNTTAAAVALTVQAATGQTADVVQIQNSSGDVLSGTRAEATGASFLLAATDDGTLMKITVTSTGVLTVETA